MNIVFDIGNVLVRWDPRFLFTQYFDERSGDGMVPRPCLQS